MRDTPPIPQLPGGYDGPLVLQVPGELLESSAITRHAVTELDANFFSRGKITYFNRFQARRRINKISTAARRVTRMVATLLPSLA